MTPSVQKVDAILCARMGSTRLPGKIMLPVLERPILAFTVERLKRSRLIDRLVVATSDLEADGEIVKLCDRMGTSCYRGSAQDVLDRVYQCARHFRMSHIAHFGADNPLIDPLLCDEIIGIYLKDLGRWDCVTNNRIKDQMPTYPDGEEVEIVSFALLEKVWQAETDPRRREHPLSLMREQPQHFRIHKVSHEPSLYHERWTLDYPEDYQFLRAVIEGLDPGGPDFSLHDILSFLDTHPKVRRINAERAHRSSRSDQPRSQVALPS